MGKLILDLRVFNGYVVTRDEQRSATHAIIVMAKCADPSADGKPSWDIVFIGSLADFQQEFPHRMARRIADGEFVSPTGEITASDFTRYLNNRVHSARPICARNLNACGIHAVSWPEKQARQLGMIGQPKVFVRSFFGLNRYGIELLSDQDATALVESVLTLKCRYPEASAVKRVWQGLPSLEAPTVKEPTPAPRYMIGATP